MKIIPPLTVTPTQLTSSNVAITETEWTAGTYNTGDQRYVGTTLYEVVASPDTTDEPTAGVLADPPTWIDIGEINRFKMFDFIIGEQTTQTGGPIDVTVDFPTILMNAVALFETTGSTVQVIVTDPTLGEVYNVTKNLTDNSGVTDWYAYFFTPIERRPEVVFTDLPAYLEASIRVIVDAGPEDTAIGELVIGRQQNIGTTLQNFSFGIEDFSRKERDAFGKFTIVERRFAKVADYDVFMNNSQIASSRKSLNGLRATPAVYIGADERPETVTLGFYRDYNVLRSGPNSSELSLEVEGLV